MPDLRNPEPILGTNPNYPDPIAILIEEYRALYALVLYRLAALEQRIPLTAGALTTVLGCVVVLPAALQLGFLFALPFSILWLVTTTINHARSLEDALRRVEEIESAVNSLSGQHLLSFQSSHPSRGREVGGRTGKETVEAVLATATLLLIGAAYLSQIDSVGMGPFKTSYLAYVAIIAAALLSMYIRLRRYRYRKQATGEVLPS